MAHGGTSWGRGPARLSILVPYCYDKTSDKSNLVGFILTPKFEITAHRGGRAWRQELETEGHTVSSIRKQKEVNSVAQLSFSRFTQFNILAYRMVSPTVGRQRFPALLTRGLSPG